MKNVDKRLFYGVCCTRDIRYWVINFKNTNTTTPTIMNDNIKISLTLSYLLKIFILFASSHESIFLWDEPLMVDNKGNPPLPRMNGNLRKSHLDQ